MACHCTHLALSLPYMAGIYIHIPFCKQKCIYCDFYSIVNPRLVDAFVAAVPLELERRIGEIGAQAADTIYIGGGTPSVLSASQLKAVVSALTAHVPMSKIREFTIEVNPDDVNLGLCRHLCDIGVSRISMGVQSFSDDELRVINRRHSAAGAIEAFNCLRKSGFSNINIDLIFGLPGQTLESWRRNIDIALSLAPEHISCYGLMYEEGTLLYRMRKEGRLAECPDSLYNIMYNELVDALVANGYLHYEISNFSLPGRHSIHNGYYWDGTPYLGIGPSAHSFDGQIRRYNPSSVAEYIKMIGMSGRAYVEETETNDERYNEYIMTRLRTMWGIAIDDMASRFAPPYIDAFVKGVAGFLSSGMLVEYAPGHFRLSEQGMVCSDSVFRELFIV